MGDFVFWSPDAAAAPESRGLREALLRALGDARRAADALERRAEGAPPAELRTAIIDERMAIEALAHTDRALVALLHAEPHLIGRQALSDVGIELDVSSRALSSYARARARGDRLRMLAAARALQRATTLASAILDERGVAT